MSVVGNGKKLIFYFWSVWILCSLIVLLLSFPRKMVNTPFVYLLIFSNGKNLKCSKLIWESIFFPTLLHICYDFSFLLCKMVTSMENFPPSRWSKTEEEELFLWHIEHFYLLEIKTMKNNKSKWTGKLIFQLKEFRFCLQANKLSMNIDNFHVLLYHERKKIFSKKAQFLPEWWYVLIFMGTHVE